MTDEQEEALYSMYMYKIGFLEGYIKGVLGDTSGDVLEQVLDRRRDDSCD